VAHGALDLLVAGVADEQDGGVLLREPDRLPVHLGHERTGGVDRVELAVGGCLHDRGTHAVGAEDDVGSRGHLGDVVDEDRAALLELGDHVDVVHDLLADVDRLPEVVERLLDGDHRAVDAGAVSTGRGEEHALRTGHRKILEPPALRRRAREVDGLGEGARLPVGDRHVSILRRAPVRRRSRRHHVA